MFVAHVGRLCRALVAVCVVSLLCAGAASAQDVVTGDVPVGDVGAAYNLVDTLSGISDSVGASTAAAQAASTSLQANATAFSTTLQSIAAGAADDPNAAATALEGAITGEAGSLESVALTQALSLASKVLAPSCQLLGATTALAPIGIDTDLAGALGPVSDLDHQTSDALLTQYQDAFAKLITPTTLPAGASSVQPYLSLAQALLGLLKVNWHTTYYPPNGGAPVVRDTPALLNVPMLLDVDGNTGFDVCGLMTLDLTTGAITQQIAKMPLSRTTMPLDIQSQFLGGVIAPGYETKGSTAPVSFSTALPLAANPVDSQLTIPGPAFTQTMNLTAALQYRFKSTGAARFTSYHFASTKPGGSTGNGTQLNYTSPSRAGSFSYTQALGSLNLAVAATPAPTSLEYCTSAKGFCSNEAPADSTTEKSSIHLLSSEAVALDQTSSAGATTCPSLALLGDAHLTGSRFFFGADTTTNPGHAWVDTDGTSVTGCLATAGTTGTLPAGFQANDRLAKWSGSGNPAPVTSKTGTVACPTGTALRGGSGLGLQLAQYLCAFPPVNTAAPTITGQTYQASTLTLNKGTWSPGAPNTPTFTYAWKRCDLLGLNCAVIPGETGATYTATAADLGRTLRGDVTATNADGTVTVTTAQTGKITLPPKPANLTPPVISGILGSGYTLTASRGTWDNAPVDFAFQWQLCDAAGNNCADISGKTTNTYIPSVSDQGHQLRVVVTASNIGGSASATSAGAFIPPPPANTGAPVIRSGTTPATGNVFEGDRLNVTDGTWQYAATFAYQWLACDADGSTCTPIPGATSNKYVVAHADIDKRLGVTVTASNPDGMQSVSAAPTGLALANALLPRTPAYVPDGTVSAAASSDRNTTFVGGAFDTVGPVVGGGGAVAATPAAASKAVGLPAGIRSGSVTAVASDTAGGYFVGGTFTAVKGTPCKAVAHIRGDGTLDPTYCQAGLTGEVRALDYVKRTVTIGASVPVDVLVIGGSFTRADGHRNLAFVDSTGLASYGPQGDPDGAVNAIADDTFAGRANFFVGGEFVNVGSVAAKRLALVSITAPPTAGAAMTLAASNYPGGVDCAGGTCTSPKVNTVALVSAGSLPNIVIGGVFDSAYGTGNVTTRVARNNAASFAEVGAPSQTVGTWDPSPNGAVTAISGSIGSATATVYLAGNFTALGTVTGFKGLAEYGLASSVTSLSPLLWSSKPSTSGTAVSSSPNTAWKPSVDNGSVLTLLSDTTTGVYVGGSFTSINGTTRHRLAQLPLPSATAPVLGAFDPNAGQTVRGLARFVPTSGTPSIFVGGDYTVLGGETRSNVAELTPAGALSTWNPAGTNGPVKALAAAGGSLYVGGTFTAAGAARNNAAAFDTASGATTEWNPNADGAVKALATSGSTVYLGGSFGNAGGAARANLAAVDGATGSASGWNPGANGSVNAILATGDDVYLGGAFGSAGGQPRAGLADIGAASGTATGWNPGVTGAVNALAVDNDVVYASGAFGAAGGATRSNIAALDRASGAATAWDPGADGAVNALLRVGQKVFAGGAFSTIGGKPRARAAQLDASTGEATEFSPDTDGTVNALTLTSLGSLGLGGSFTVASGASTSGVMYYGG